MDLIVLTVAQAVRMDSTTNKRRLERVEPRRAVARAVQSALDPKLERLGLQLRAVVSTCTDMYLPMEAPAHAVSPIAHVYYRP